MGIRLPTACVHSYFSRLKESEDSTSTFYSNKDTHSRIQIYSQENLTPDEHTNTHKQKDIERNAFTQMHIETHTHTHTHTHTSIRANIKRKTKPQKKKTHTEKHEYIHTLTQRTTHACAHRYWKTHITDFQFSYVCWDIFNLTFFHSWFLGDSKTSICSIIFFFIISTLFLSSFIKTIVVGLLAFVMLLFLSSFLDYLYIFFTTYLSTYFQFFMMRKPSFLFLSFFFCSQVLVC